MNIISSIIAPWSDIDPLILMFSIFTLSTLLIVSFLVTFFEGSTFSIDGEESSLPFVTWSSTICLSTGGGSKKVAQKTRTNV